MALVDRNLNDAQDLRDLAASLLTELADEVSTRRPEVESKLREVRAVLPAPPHSSRLHGQIGLELRPSENWSVVQDSVNETLAQAELGLTAATDADTLQGALHALDRTSGSLDEAEERLPALRAAIKAHDGAAAHHEAVEAKARQLERSRDIWQSTSRTVSRVRNYAGTLVFCGIVLLLIGIAWSPAATTGAVMICVAIAAVMLNPLVNAKCSQLSDATYQTNEQIRTHERSGRPW